MRIDRSAWPDIFAEYASLLQSREGESIRKQYEIFTSGGSLKVVDPKIKEIPIHENGEELIDLKFFPDLRIGMMPDPEKPFGSPECYSGLPNASKLRKGIFLRLRQMVDELDHLASSFGYRPGQVDIRIFEGLRDLPTQKNLYDRKFEEIRKGFPHFTLEEVSQETCKWVAPVENNIPIHSTGAAVDIRLWDKMNRVFLDLGIFGVIWGLNRNAPTFSENISEIQKKNRLFCALAAARARLTNYFYEYWHFSSGDRYDAWFHQKPNAIYNSAILH